MDHMLDQIRYDLQRPMY